MALTAPTRQPVILRAIHPNAGLEADYRRQLQQMVKAMHRSTLYWLRAAWRKAPPLASMAHDAAPVAELRKTMRRLGAYWQEKFDQASDTLTASFADKSIIHTDTAMVSALAEAGFAVHFRYTAAVREAVGAVMQANVGLIRSIPAKYLQAVEGDVWRAVASGWDLEAMTKALHYRYGSTWKRAALIAQDQSNKAKAAIEDRRRADLGIKQAIWQHSGGGKVPRPEHVRWGREHAKYDITKGMWSEVDGVYVLPGTAIHCRCTSRAIIPGYNA